MRVVRVDSNKIVEVADSGELSLEQWRGLFAVTVEWHSSDTAQEGQLWNDGNPVDAPAVALTPSEQAAKDKIEGVEIEGVMCSATSDDQVGMLAVAYQHDMDPANYPGTVFQFENGNALTITKDNYQAVHNIWMAFRASFFAVS